MSNFSGFLRFARAVVMGASWGTPKFSSFSKEKFLVAIYVCGDVQGAFQDDWTKK